MNVIRSMSMEYQISIYIINKRNEYILFFAKILYVYRYTIYIDIIIQTIDYIVQLIKLINDSRVFKIITILFNNEWL